MTAIAFPIGGIDDGDVRLRLHADSDLEGVAAASLDPEVLRWAGVPDENSVELMREWLDEWRSKETELHLVVVDATSDELLGAVGIVNVDLSDGRCGIGYWIARDARGRDLASRAVRLLSGWVFAELPIERIEIHCEPANGGSRAVAESSGFTFEGILRSYFTMKGRRRDAAVYSLLLDEWRLPSE